MGKSISEDVIAEIRQRRSRYETIKGIAAAMGIGLTTVNKYASELNLMTHKRSEKKRYFRVKRDPEVMKIRRERALTHYHNSRGASQAEDHETP